jgi:hypothetical protein
MIRPSTLTAVALSLATAASLCAATISFDNLPSETQLTNQYASQGVVFDQIWASARYPTNVVTLSTPNYATPFYLNGNPGTILFVDPGNAAAPAYATSVTLSLNAYNNGGGWFDGAVVTAYDLNGNAIAGQTQTIAPTTGVNRPAMDITFTGQVHEIQLVDILTPNGDLGVFPFDNMSFSTPVRSPEPSTLMLGCGVLVVAWVAQRRRKQP